jgi:hypothetical protein
MKKIIFLGVLTFALLSTVFIIQSNVAAKDAAEIGQCISDCASEQGICIGQCNGDGQCINRCAAAYGRCVARCN